jgi:hypothetical protein
MPVVIWHRAVLHAARFRQHLESDEGGVGSEHLIVIAQEGADDVAHDAFATAAGNHVVHFHVVLARQHFAQIEPAIGVEIQPREITRHGLDRFGRRAQRVFVRPQLGDAAQAILPAHAFNRAARFVRPQGFYIGRNKWH